MSYTKLIRIINLFFRNCLSEALHPVAHLFAALVEIHDLGRRVDAYEARCNARNS